MLSGFCWFITALASCAAGYLVVVTAASAQGEARDATNYVLALTIVVVPYVFTRAVEGLGRTFSEERTRQKDAERAPDGP